MMQFTALMVATPWLAVLILVLATYSITRLITEDTIADPIRNWFFTHWPNDGFTSKVKPKRGKLRLISQGTWYVDEGTKLGELISCPWCSGFWVALLVCVAAWFAPIWTILLLTPLALRVVPGMLNSWANRS